jgi:hypothetical protein
MKVGYYLGSDLEVMNAALTAVDDWQYMLLQSPAAIRFTHYEPSTSWAAWEQGVVFGPTAHLQWRRRRGGRWHLVLLTHGAWPDTLTLMGEATSLGQEAFYLWGERQFLDGRPQAAWVEGRIPQIISGDRGYPLSTAPTQAPARVQLVGEVLELPPAAAAPDAPLDPTPPRRLSRYLGLREVQGEAA